MGSECSQDRVVAKKSDCKIAASQLGLKYTYAKNSIGAEKYPAGCFYSTFNEALFNPITDPSLTSPAYSVLYGGICFEGGT